MRWDAVLKATGDQLASNTELFGIFGQNIRVAGDNELFLPGINIRVISDTIEEQWDREIFQYDIWTEEWDHLLIGERLTRKELDHESPLSIQGVYMWSQWEGGAELGQAQSTVGPESRNFYGRALRFRHTPITEALRRGRSS